MSWAEEMGYDSYYDGPEWHPDIEDVKVWVGSEEILRWREIDIDYLENIVNGLKAGKWESQAHKLERAEKELAKRQNTERRWWK